MELYYLTESDPLEKFLFPYESEALRGDNFDDFEMAFFIFPVCHHLYVISSVFCPEEMKTTLDKILHHGRLSAHRKVSFIPSKVKHRIMFYSGPSNRNVQEHFEFDNCSLQDNLG